jgi:large subunit ribosomal protein L25
LDADVSLLEINQAVHVSDLPHPGSIKFLDDEGLTIAHVSMIKEEVVAVEEVVAEPTEPEIAKKGKGETESAPDAKTETKPDAKADAKADAKKK